MTALPVDAPKRPFTPRRVSIYTAGAKEPSLTHRAKATTTEGRPLLDTEKQVTPNRVCAAVSVATETGLKRQRAKAKVNEQRTAMADTFLRAGTGKIRKVKAALAYLRRNGDLTSPERQRKGRNILLWDATDPPTPTPFLPKALRQELKNGRRLLDLGERMTLCGQFYLAQTCGSCGVEVPPEKEIQPIFCKARGCPVCERARAVGLKRFLPLLTDHATYRLKFMTLTVPNVPTLEGRDQAGTTWNALKLLSRCFMRFRRFMKAQRYCFQCSGFEQRRGVSVSTCSCPPGERRRSRWRKISLGGTLRSLELTYGGKKKGWHPHIHAIVDGPYLPQTLLAAAWSRITEQYWPTGASNQLGVDIRVVTGSVEDAARELLKYPTKLADLVHKPGPLGEWVQAVKGVRCVQATGAWFGLQAKIEEELERPEAPEPEFLTLPCPCCGVWAWSNVPTRIHPHDKPQKSTHGPPAKGCDG